MAPAHAADHVVAATRPLDLRAAGAVLRFLCLFNYFLYIHIASFVTTATLSFSWTFLAFFVQQRVSFIYYSFSQAGATPIIVFSLIHTFFLSPIIVFSFIAYYRILLQPLFLFHSPSCSPWSTPPTIYIYIYIHIYIYIYINIYIYIYILIHASDWSSCSSWCSLSKSIV